MLSQKIKHLVSALLLSVAHASAVYSDVNVPRDPILIGTVAFVDTSSIIHIRSVKVKSPNIPKRDEYLIKPFALDIPPAQLAILVGGRTLNCRYFADLGSAMIADCTTQDINGRRLAHTPDRVHLDVSVRNLAQKYGLGEMRCSEAELRSLTEAQHHRVNLCRYLLNGLPPK